MLKLLILSYNLELAHISQPACTPHAHRRASSLVAGRHGGQRVRAARLPVQYKHSGHPGTSQLSACRAAADEAPGLHLGLRALPAATSAACGPQTGAAGRSLGSGEAAEPSPGRRRLHTGRGGGGG